MTESNLDNNPLLVTEGFPRFDEIEPEHVVPGVRQILKLVETRITELEFDLQPTWEGVMKPLEELDLPFEYGWGPVQHLFGVKNSPELREAYETVQPELVQLSLRIKQSEPIYKAQKALKEGSEWATLTEAQQRIVESSLLSAELAGIALSEDDRAKFNENAKELSQISTEYSNHVLDATKAFSLTITDHADVEGIPPTALQIAAETYNEENEGPPATTENGPWQFTLAIPSYLPLMQHCPNRELREKMYRAFVTRASEGELDNTPIITRILQLRQEQAKLLGYETYAEVSLAKKMAPSVDAVEKMFEELRSASWSAAEQDLKELEELASSRGQTEPLAHWDVAYWAERLREDRFNYTDEELRPYFSMENVLDGMFQLVNRIFGITVKQVEGKAPVWNDDVRYFEIFDEEAKQIAAFYLDPYSRPKNKRGGAWMDECLNRRPSDNGLQVPIAHLVCNGTPPVGDKPSLMTFREVETLFHEFGHGLHHMLTRVDYPGAAGINNVEWDAVELPSQFMENWCYHKPTLLGMTAHYETGEPLPEELFNKIVASRNFRAGTDMLRQLLFGMTDMELHHRHDPDGSESVFELQARIAEKTQVMPLLPESRSLCAFEHIFAGGYAAGYYSYKWAEVLSADAFGAFEDAGLDDETQVAATGRRFRETVLALGGSRHPMEIFKEFRGREPSTAALLKHSGLA